jgi:hypothetical protein
LPAIYRLEGDALTLSWRDFDTDKGPPVDFNGGPGIGVIEFRRKKP